MGAALGAAAFVVRVATPPLSPTSTWFSAVLEGLEAVVLLWAGYAAKRRGRRPPIDGAAVGFLYGLIAGLGDIVNPTTFADERRFLLARQAALRHSILKLSRSQIVHDARLYTTAAAHWEAVLGSVLYGVLFGLVLGWVGSLFYTPRARGQGSP